MEVGMVALLSRRCRHSRGFLLKKYIALVWITALLVAFGITTFLSNLRAPSSASDAYLVMYVAIKLVMTWTAYWILRPWRRARATHRTTDDEAPESASSLCLPTTFSVERSRSMGSDTMSSSSVSVANELAVGSVNVHCAALSILGLRTLENDGASPLSTSKKDIRREQSFSLAARMLSPLDSKLVLTARRHLRILAAVVSEPKLSATGFVW